jgi:3-dehydroquinate synthase
MRRVKVPLGDRSYSILIGNGLLARLGSACRRLSLGQRCALISDTHVAPLYAKIAEESLQASGFDPVRITFPAGEVSKQLSTVQRVYEQLAANRFERKSFIIALGGGVVGDLAGFVAATYLRGLPCVQVPTTLLAAVDSSVGGKTGVNLKTGKNLVGAFYQPRQVLCDLDTLKTLPNREFISGLAEVIKYGVIYDPQLFADLEKSLGKILAQHPGTLASVIARCCEIKAEVVSQDETESGLRAILNFGHTIGHALESTFAYRKHLHGEAIAIGQVAAAFLSQQLLGLPEAQVNRLIELLRAAGLPAGIRLTPAQATQLMAAMKLDKKVSHGEIKFVLASKIGQVRWGQSVSSTLVEQSLSFVAQVA